MEGSKFAFKGLVCLECIPCHLVDLILDARTTLKLLKVSLEPSIKKTRSADVQMSKREPLAPRHPAVRFLVSVRDLRVAVNRQKMAQSSLKTQCGPVISFCTADLEHLTN